MNLCRARLDYSEGSSPVVRFGNNSLGIDKSSIDKYPLVPEHIGQEVVLGTRPESFFIPGDNVSDDQRIRTRVDLVEFLGAEALVYLQTDAEPVGRQALLDDILDQDSNGAGASRNMAFVARIDPRAAPKRGDLVDVAYETDALHFFDLENGAALR